MRGIPADAENSILPPWITPACAGNTNTGNFNAGDDKDYPRVCGEYADKIIGLATSVVELTTAIIALIAVCKANKQNGGK